MGGYKTKRILTEADVRTAVANAIKFLERTVEPYGLLFLAMIYRRYGVPQFADALERYDNAIANRTKQFLAQERVRPAPLLRVLRRFADPNNPLQPDDWDAVVLHNDRIFASALYCDRLGLPPSFVEVLRNNVRHGGYFLTHALLAWICIQENRCEWAVPAEFVEEMYAAATALIDDNPTMVNDLKLEAAAFLCLARQAPRIDPNFVRRVVATQNEDGGWGEPDEGWGEPDESGWHSTILALILLLHVEFPGAPHAGEQ